MICLFAGTASLSAEPVRISVTDDPVADHPLPAETPLEIQPASLLQPQPFLLPPLEDISQPVALPPAAWRFSRRMNTSSRPAPIGTRPMTPAQRVLFGGEAGPRMASDAGSLTGKSPAALGISVQKRSPVVSEPRVRSSQVGSTAASGSYWVPARIDLDTMLSKVDSRLLEDMTVISGPYSVQHGPDYKFIDFRLTDTPRFDCGPQTSGTTTLNYMANGQQVYGRQLLAGGAADWGFRASYGQRTANDYQDGTGANVPASYNSRDADVAIGFDFDEARRIDFSYLRLDQSVVELPGQAFDINFLTTDAFSVRYYAENQPRFDRLSLEAWYNRTNLAGDNFRPGKPAQFPAMDLYDLVAETDVQSQSAGYKFAATWGADGCQQVTIGTDLRFVVQELDEVADAEFGDIIFTDIDSPIPRSTWLDPGVFIEYTDPGCGTWSWQAGARLDYVTTEVLEDPGVVTSRSLTLAELYGTDDFDRQYLLWSAYLSGRLSLTDNWSALIAVGRGARPPNLTELYAAEPFMLLLQSGQNTITGTPLLKPERVWQADLGLEYETSATRLGANAFCAAMFDYITFEALDAFRIRGGAVEQVNLQYVNTDFASKFGFELHADHDLSPLCLAFATVSYVDGRDHTRNGDFATNALTADGNFRVPGRPRGDFSGIAGAASEPLPMIFPLESRLGVRFHAATGGTTDPPRWMVELAVRMVARQDRIATSLVETPTPGFSVWDVRAFWQATDRLLLLAGIENFGDRTYREHFDFRSVSGRQLFQPGANAYVGTEWAY